MTAVGTKAITVSYTEGGITKTTSFTVTVVKKTLSSLSVTTKPAKTTYTVGETLDTSGMIVRATYSDDSTANVTGYTCSPTALNTEGTKLITVSYTEGGITKTTSFTVTVVKLTLTGIAVKTMPTKTKYNVGDSFNQSGLTLTATYSNGSTKTITSGFTCSGFSSATEGTKTITVTYEEKTATFTVTVIKPAAFKVGDIVSFGSYPQTRVTDNATIEALNKQSATWRSHGYYSGTKTEYSTTYDGKMTASDYMKYCDVTYGGKTYRGVRFSQFRPSYTDYPGNLSSQSINGYYTNTTYWFRWEPLYWRVLDPNTGLVLSEQIIDSQPYNNYMLSSGKDEYDRNAVWGDAKKTYYANNYAHSSLRSWLTDTANPTSFLNVAFTQTQRNALLQTTLDNSAYSKSYSAYDSASTTDTVFLLAYKDMLNTAYGFRSNDDDPNRQASGSDYAQCQGLHYGSTSEWWLRSAGRYSYTAGITASYGGLYLSMNANKTDVGVRPAVRMDLRSATPVTVTGIAIKSLPQKTAYVVGDDSFSQTGLTVTATYSDGSSRVTASGLVCTGFNTTTAGMKTITVTYHNKTATFTVTVESKPTITIRNYTASKTVDYRTTITFEAEVKPEVSGACIYWFIDGKEDEAGVTDLSFDYKTVEEAKKSFTIQAKYMKDGKVLAESEVETVKVKSGIFARLIAFFRALFGLLPKVTQDYLGVEIINRVLPD